MMHVGPCELFYIPLHALQLTTHFLLPPSYKNGVKPDVDLNICNLVE